MLQVREVKAKSILNKSKVYTYCLNPYTGCEHNCRYCYARLFMRRYSGHKEAWGEFVDVKINAPSLLHQQLQRAKRGTVWISSVCDPYQPLEARYKLTRACLQHLAAHQFPVVIQTKSNLVLRDIDILLQFYDIEVGFTIPTDMERIAGLFEPKAPPLTERLKALEKIHKAGIKTFVFIGPLLPSNPERLVSLIAGKADYVYLDKMNYMPTILNFYRQHHLEEAATATFFHRQKEKFVAAFKKSKIKTELLY
ncbi:MAG: radical SAM protein [Candidatus Aminicenantales bacterium]